MGRLDDKVAITTGAGSGIGRATAVLFAKEGAKVVVADWVTETGDETVKMIKEAGGEAVFIKTDVSKAGDVKSMVKRTVDTYGKLDVLFNNAGILGEMLVTTDYREEEWDKIMNINLKGVWLCMKYAIPEMVNTMGGSIINVASLGATEGVSTQPAYCASKGGVIALSQVAAAEYAAQNIRINWINPNFILTPMLQAMLKTDAEFEKQFKALVPMCRLAKPEEVAYAALFLASDESSYMTSTGLVVDGGMTGISSVGRKKCH